MVVFQEKKRIIDNNVLFEFQGNIDSKNTKAILEKITELDVHKRVIKDLYLCVNELFQNAQKLSDPSPPPRNVTLKISACDSLCFFYISENILTKHALQIENQINELNSRSKEELKQIHKDRLHNPCMSKKLNLGYIYLRRRTCNNILMRTTVLNPEQSQMEQVFQFANKPKN